MLPILPIIKNTFLPSPNPIAYHEHFLISGRSVGDASSSGSVTFSALDAVSLGCQTSASNLAVDIWFRVSRVSSLGLAQNAKRSTTGVLKLQ